MGLFSNERKNQANSIYKRQVKPRLKTKDNNIHVLMIDSFSKWINQNFGIEDKYTEQIDPILSAMQNDGYEIVDVKFSTLQNQGITKQMEGFNTLIIYK